MLIRKAICSLLSFFSINIIRLSNPHLIFNRKKKKLTSNKVKESVREIKDTLLREVTHFNPIVVISFHE